MEGEIIRRFPESREIQPATIRLEFFRHDEKGKPGEGQPDAAVRLSEKGRKSAIKKGKEKRPSAEIAMAYGSPRDRAIETAMRQMLASEESITDDMTLEDIRKLVNEEVKVGRKDIITDKLDPQWRGSEDFAKVVYDHYFQKKDALNFMYRESDQLVRNLKDKKSTSFTRQAGNVAELIQRYIDILPTWRKLVEQNPEKYAQNNQELQRFFGSHHTVPESFLMKVIEKLHGPKAVDDFISELDDKNGFNASEGFNITMTAGKEGVTVTIKYKDKTFHIEPNIVKKIINEREEFDKSIV